MPAIDTLPSEILVIIFEEAQFISAFHRLVPFELVCSHVCSRWRSIALEAPSLWSTIVAAECKPIDKLVTYLERSKAYPLHIRFDYTHEGREEHVQSIIAFSKILPNLHRSITLRMRMSEKMFVLFHEECLARLHAPLLTHLSISVVEDSPIDRSDKLSIGMGLGGLPSLSLVHLSGFKPLQCCFPSLSTVTILHLHQTGDSDYPSLTYPQLCQIINASPLLEKLSLHGEVLTSWNPPLSGSLEAKNLRSLTIKFMPVPSFLFYLFTILEAPKLHELSLMSISDTDMDPVSANALTLRTFPSVSQLLLEAPRLTMRMLSRFCKIVPYITELTIRGGMTVEMEMFLRQSKRWARLHTIELLGSTHLVKWPALNAILDARILGQNPLKVVRVPNVSEKRKAQGKVEVRVVENEVGYPPWWIGLEREPWWMGDDQDWRE